MQKRTFLALAGSVSLGALLPRTSAAAGAGTSQTQAIATAATGFLDQLSAPQRTAVQFPHTVQPQDTAAPFKGGMWGNVDMVGEQYGRSTWSNYPVSDVPRPAPACAWAA